SVKYLHYFLAGRPSVDPDLRQAVATTIAASFPLHALVAERLRHGPVRVLFIQNVADGQGDELIRVVPLLSALLEFNPELQGVLVTGRGYLYGHPRVRLVPIDDGQAVRQLLEQPFDGVVHCFETSAALPSYDDGLGTEVEAYVQLRAPFLYLVARTGASE